MQNQTADNAFRGSVPELYHAHLVPLIFTPFAQDLVGRLAERSPGKILEVAAGTGVVTREMAARLPASTEIVATDLNQGMLDQGTARGIPPGVTWQKADALGLPFPDATFDAVVCQFGCMFFSDKPKAFAEARRVLAPGGTLFLNIWDRIEENELADAVTTAVAALSPSDPPRFLARVPYGYHDRATIERDLATAGFGGSTVIETVAARSRAPSAEGPAIGFVQGTPLRNEIEARDPSGLPKATAAATEAIVNRFGSGPLDRKIQAHVVTAGR